MEHGGISTLATSTEAYFHFAPGAGLLKARQRHDEAKEGLLWRMRLREQRTRVAWRPSTIPWATLAPRGALAGDAVILI